MKYNNNKYNKKYYSENYTKSIDALNASGIKKKTKYNFGSKLMMKDEKFFKYCSFEEFKKYSFQLKGSYFLPSLCEYLSQSSFTHNKLLFILEKNYLNSSQLFHLLISISNQNFVDIILKILDNEKFIFNETLFINYIFQYSASYSIDFVLKILLHPKIIITSTLIYNFRNYPSLLIELIKNDKVDPSFNNNYLLLNLISRFNLNPSNDIKEKIRYLLKFSSVKDKLDNKLYIRLIKYKFIPNYLPKKIVYES